MSTVNIKVIRRYLDKYHPTFPKKTPNTWKNLVPYLEELVGIKNPSTITSLRLRANFAIEKLKKTIEPTRIETNDKFDEEGNPTFKTLQLIVKQQFKNTNNLTGYRQVVPYIEALAGIYPDKTKPWTWKTRGHIAYFALKQKWFNSYNQQHGKILREYPIPNDVSHFLTELGKTITPKRERLPKLPILEKTIDDANNFYTGFEWKNLRYRIIKAYGRKCLCCGSTPNNGVQLNVDHIKPLRRYWNLRLDPENLQVLCNECNRGKGNIDETDWRPPDYKNILKEHGLI
jgi:hypothetical protein